MLIAIQLIVALPGQSKATRERQRCRACPMALRVVCAGLAASAALAFITPVRPAPAWVKATVRHAAADNDDDKVLEVESSTRYIILRVD